MGTSLVLIGCCVDDIVIVTIRGTDTFNFCV
jgi:hypothetical protein